MSRFAFVVAVLAMVTCKKNGASPAHTEVFCVPAMSPAPAMMDTTKHDSSMSSTTTTSTMTKTATTMKTDTAMTGVKKP